MQDEGFRAVKHQSFVGTGYFDYVQNTVQNGASTVALKDSTETEQF
jgi:isocitrate lyase